MPPPRRGDRKKNPSASVSKPHQTRQDPARPAPPTEQSETKKIEDNGAEPSGFNLSTTIPTSLQQLLLDVFKTALLSPSSTEALRTDPVSDPNTYAHALDTKSLIQTIKARLYQRDFDSAFTDADEDLLRAYALRWSAARALGYAGLLKSVLRFIHFYDAEDTLARGNHSLNQHAQSTRVVCLGGGAGAEIVALAAAWRDLGFGAGGMEDGVAGLSMSEQEEHNEENEAEDCPSSPVSSSLSITAVDIADWSSVIDRLSQTIASPTVPTPSTSKHQPPLVPAAASPDTPASFTVAFRRADVLSLSESELQDVLVNAHDISSKSPSTSISTPAVDTPSSSLLVTLMFTLNELFSTSMPKTTALLLRMTETLPPGAVLLVVDSPGSYSTLKLGKSSQDGSTQERKYPMKFLLDHTLLSVAQGKWERVFTQDSRWWRRDAARLRYEVGEGAGLEDMRFQVHLYRRIKE